MIEILNYDKLTNWKISWKFCTDKLGNWPRFMLKNPRNHKVFIRIFYSLGFSKPHYYAPKRTSYPYHRLL
jgi:hypothetical protein